MRILVILGLLVLGCYDGTGDKVVEEKMTLCSEKSDLCSNGVHWYQECGDCFEEDAYGGECFRNYVTYYKVDDATYSNIIDMIEDNCQ